MEPITGIGKRPVLTCPTPLACAQVSFCSWFVVVAYYMGIGSDDTYCKGWCCGGYYSSYCSYGSYYQTSLTADATMARPRRQALFASQFVRRALLKRHRSIPAHSIAAVKEHLRAVCGLCQEERSRTFAHNDPRRPSSTWRTTIRTMRKGMDTGTPTRMGGSTTRKTSSWGYSSVWRCCYAAGPV